MGQYGRTVGTDDWYAGVPLASGSVMVTHTRGVRMLCLSY